MFSLGCVRYSVISSPGLDNTNGPEVMFTNMHDLPSLLGKGEENVASTGYALQLEQADFTLMLTVTHFKG